MTEQPDSCPLVTSVTRHICLLTMDSLFLGSPKLEEMFPFEGDKNADSEGESNGKFIVKKKTK